MRQTKDYGLTARVVAASVLAEAFTDEWRDLDDDDAANVVSDFLETNDEDGVSASEYRGRIGKGNLASYADVLRVQR